MASDVRAALVQLMAAPSRLNSHDAAVKKLAEMQLKGRYLQVEAAPALGCWHPALLSLRHVALCFLTLATPGRLELMDAQRELREGNIGCRQAIKIKCACLFAVTCACDASRKLR
jgi:hypothetical protein